MNLPPGLWQLSAALKTRWQQTRLCHQNLSISNAQFGRFRIASDLHKKSEEIQVNSLLYAMGDSADDVLTMFVFDEEGDDLKYDKVKGKFDQYFTVRRNVIYK